MELGNLIDLPNIGNINLNSASKSDIPVTEAGADFDSLLDAKLDEVANSGLINPGGSATLFTEENSISQRFQLLIQDILADKTLSKEEKKTKVNETLKMEILFEISYMLFQNKQSVLGYTFDSDMGLEFEEDEEEDQGLGLSLSDLM